MSADPERGLKNEEINPALLESRNKLSGLRTGYEQAAGRVHETRLSDSGDRGAESFAIARLALDQNPDLKLITQTKSELPRQPGIYFNYGTEVRKDLLQGRAWVEISRGDQTILIIPTIGPSGPSFSEQVVNNRKLAQAYKRSGLQPASMEDILFTEYWFHHHALSLENILDDPGKGKVPWSYINWWRKFREASGFYRAVPEVEDFMHGLPRQNRDLAIEQADQKRVNFLMGVWTGELKRLPPKIVQKQGLTPDQEGWQKYLRLCFKVGPESFRKQGEFDEWSIKFCLQMLNVLEGETDGEPVGKGRKKRKSYFEYYTEGRIGLETIWSGSIAPISNDSLLVHSLDESSLVDVINSGLVGRGGRGTVAMCQDRIAYDQGWIIVFQASDLLKAGYPLVAVNEDAADAHILKEWRSMPLDINLARLVVSMSAVPDRNIIANNPQIARFYCGEDFLRKIERI